MDNLLTPDVANVFYIKAVLVATGKMTPQAFAAEMDKNAGSK